MLKLGLLLSFGLLTLKNVRSYEKETLIYNDYVYSVESNMEEYPVAKASATATTKEMEMSQIVDKYSNITSQETFDPDANNKPVSFVELNTTVDFTNANVVLQDSIIADTESALAGLVLVEAVDLAQQIVNDDIKKFTFEEREDKFEDEDIFANAAIALARATAINEICATALFDLSMVTQIEGLDEDSNGDVDRTLQADVSAKAIALAQAIAEAVAKVTTDDFELFSQVKVDALAKDIELAVIQAYITKDFDVDGETVLADQDARSGETEVCAEAVAQVVAEAIAIQFVDDDDDDLYQFVDGQTKIMVEGSDVEVVEEGSVRADSTDELPDLTNSKIKQVLPRSPPPPFPPTPDAPSAPTPSPSSSTALDAEIEEAFITSTENTVVIINNEKVVSPKERIKQKVVKQVKNRQFKNTSKCGPKCQRNRRRNCGRIYKC